MPDQAATPGSNINTHTTNTSSSHQQQHQQQPKRSNKSSTKLAAESDPTSSSERCRFYLPRKKRYCGWPAIKGGDYCGNHVYEATGAGETRVGCPANPKHLVAVSQLMTHVPKCSDAIYQAGIRAQPCFCENLNAGADEYYGLQDLQDRLAAATALATAAAAAAAAAVTATASTPPPAAAAAVDSASALSVDTAAAAEAAAMAAAAAAGLVPTGPDAAAVAAVAAEASASFLKGTAAERQAAAVALGPDGFAALLSKIEAAHAVLTSAHPLHTRMLWGTEHTPALQETCKAFHRLFPFDAKHALQNACIVGNMAAAGLLQQSRQAETVFVELGAGKAWLTAWLHMLHPSTRQFVLLDKMGNFCNKADRRLRHTSLTRVAVDLKDAALLPLLQQHMAQAAAEQAAAQAAAAAAAAQAEGLQVQGGSVGVANSSSIAGSSNGSNCQHEQQSQQTCQQQQQQCQDEKALSDGQKQQRQHQEQSLSQVVVPWVVMGKHLCGAATDFALRACLHTLAAQQQPQQQQSQQFELQGLAIASCCHHRCGWMSYTGRQELSAAAGITKADFEVIAWLTGWALCGHEAAPGAAAGAEGGGEADAEDAEGGSGAAAAAAAVEAGGVGGSGNKSVSSSMTAGEVKQHPADGREECSCDAGDASGGSSSREQGVHTQQRQQGNAGRPGAWHPAQMLSHQQRIQLGLKCKQLLDAGRCAWLQKQLAPMLMSQQQQQQRGEVSEGAGRVGGELQVQRVAYIDPSITGENTLLLLGRCC